MDTSHLDVFTHLHRNPDGDIATFAEALAIKAINTLVVNGGSDFGRPQSETAVAPPVVRGFIERACQQHGLFSKEWERLLEEMPRIALAWERGKTQFRQEMAASMKEQEEYTFLKQRQVESYAAGAAKGIYWADYPQEQWMINGYMVAWRAWLQENNLTADLI